MSDAIPLRTQPLESPTLRRRRSSDDREAPLLTPIPSVAESAPAAAPRRCSWKYFLCGTPHRAAFCCTVAVAITLAVVLPLVFCVVVPRVVDRMIAASTLTVVCGSLGPATADSLVVAVTVRLDNAGPFGASLSVFNAAVYGPATPNTAAQPIGTMAFPELLISPSAATHLSITSLLKVSSAEAFRAATIPILRGDGADWEVRGAATVSVGALRVPVYVTKTLRMPATSVDEMTSSDAALEKGDGSSGVLSVSADASFISTSVLELHGLGDLVVEVCDGGRGLIFRLRSPSGYRFLVVFYSSRRSRDAAQDVVQLHLLARLFFDCGMGNTGRGHTSGGVCCGKGRVG